VFGRKSLSLTAIVLASLLVGAGYLINTYGVLTPLARFTQYIERSLESFDATNLARTFYYELTGCTIKGAEGTGVSVVCEPEDAGTLDALCCTRTGECENQTGFLEGIFMATVKTAEGLWSGSTWLGVLLFAGALTLSGIWLAKTLSPQDEPALWLLWLLLVPAMASLAALVLKWLLLLFVVLFSQALAGIVWAVATFGGVIVWFKAGLQVFTTAHQIEKLGKNPASPDPADGKRE